MNQVLITRKIEVIIDESGQKKKEMFAKLKNWRDIVRTAANIIVSHKFIQKNVADFEYLTDETMEKITVADIIKKGPGMSVQNITYRALAQAYGKEIPSYILSSLNQAVSKMFNETYSQVKSGDSSLRNYKNNIPIPFPSSAIRKFKEVTDEDTGKFKHYSFLITDIPFKTYFGRDESQNRILLERCFDENNKDYRLRSFSISIDTRGEKVKIFFYAVIQCPIDDFAKAEKSKKLYAQLSVNTPIICSSNPTAIPYMSNYTLYEHRQNLLELASQIKEFDKTLGENTKKEIEDIYSLEKGKFPHIEQIGNKEEFLYRRIQIQRAVRRCQKNNRYATGGKGRERKCQAIERWHKIEHNYVETKMHTYAKLLVQQAKAQKCKTIVLCDQEQQELDAKAAHKAKKPFLLRNWSYYGLKSKIEYKAALYGIDVVEELSAKSLVVNFEGDNFPMISKFSKKISGKTFKVTDPTVNIPNIDKYDIIYIGMTSINNNKNLIESFITNNIVSGDKTIVPYICSDEDNHIPAIESLKSSFPNLGWWKEVIFLHQISEDKIKEVHKTISNSMDL